VERTTWQMPISASSALAAWIAIAASGAAAALLISLHVLSPEFSPAWRMISEYANGQHGWVLSLMFIAYGLSILALAVAIRPHFNTRRQNFGLALLVLSGIGAASAAQFDLNQAVLHELAGVVGILCLPIAAMLTRPSLAATAPSGRAKNLILLAANLTWLSVVLWIASFVLMIVTFLLALGGLPETPPEELPAGVIAVVGWTNRLMVLSAWCWVATVARHVIRLRSTAGEALQDIYLRSAARKETVGA
jgi:hypothetical membrane protein